MSERVYKTMKKVGDFNLVLGILVIVAGLATGVCLIAQGARLLREKGNLIF